MNTRELYRRRLTASAVRYFANFLLRDAQSYCTVRSCELNVSAETCVIGAMRAVGGSELPGCAQGVDDVVR